MRHLSQNIYRLNTHTNTQTDFENSITNDVNVDSLTHENTPDIYFEQLSMKNDIEEILSSLTPRESKVLKMRFGLGKNMIDHTSEEIAYQFDVTRERIRQIQAKALRKLRHITRRQVIEDYEEVA
jgi:RNA polymerase sigma factor (sigma-70 family)